MITSIYPELDRYIQDWGRRARQWRSDADFTVAEKTPGDFVTSVDQSLDDAFTQQLQAWFPEDGIISEESQDSPDRWQSGRKRLWCIDPIDGTLDFVNGAEGYSVMIGILDQGIPTAGWIYAPAWDILYFGDVNQQKVWRWQGSVGEEVAIVPPPDCGLQVILSEKDDRTYGAAIRQVLPDARFYTLGSFGLKIMEVVLGKSSLYLYLNRRVKVWDTVAPLALARAAGLVCCDLTGADIQFHGEAVDPKTLTHQQVVVVGWKEVIDRYLAQLQAVLSLPT